MINNNKYNIYFFVPYKCWELNPGLIGVNDVY